MSLQENISIKPFNSFGIDASAKYFATFSSVMALQELLAAARNTGDVPLMVLGGGSNVLFTKDFNGLILKNALTGIDLVKEDKHHYYVKAMAGENWHGFVSHCIERNYGGIENLSLIPGDVGASPMQNIGAYGVELKDVFFSLEAYDLQENKIQLFSLNDCHFSYRSSIFKEEAKGRYIILSVTFLFQKEHTFNTSYGAIEQELQKMEVSQLSLKALSEAVIRIRRSKLPDPEVLGNAGSFFKNPMISSEKFSQLEKDFPGIPGFRTADGQVKLAAGWLIESCGWKGYRKGDAGCYEKQALVLVNYGNASGKEIWDLSENILQNVQQQFGITLEREVNII